MTDLQATPERPETAPQPSSAAGTPENPRNSFSAVRKACTALIVGALLATGAGFASNGFTENTVDVSAAQTHDAQSRNGLLSTPTGSGAGGVVTADTKALAAVKTAPVDDYPCVHPPLGEKYGTVSIPKFGADWNHYLIEGAEPAQLDSPGTDDPDAVENYKTAIGHSTCTQTAGEIGNFGLEGHRTPNTFRDLDTLNLGDTISITEAKTGTVYTYAVTQTMREMPFITLPEKEAATAAMNPVPFDNTSIFTPTHVAKTKATKRLLTMTSCGADLATTKNFRVYVQAELQSVSTGEAVK